MPESIGAAWPEADTSRAILLGGGSRRKWYVAGGTLEERTEVWTDRVSNPQASRFPGLFCLEVVVMRFSRDWWAVIVAALAVALVKLGVIAGVAW